MKKSLLAAVAVVLLAFSHAWAGHFTDILPPASASGCVPVSNGYDYNCSTDSGAPVIQSSAPVSIIGKTLTQINALVPTGPGQIVSCTNCTQAQICVSSGTGTGAWVLPVATGTFTAASYPHCL